MKIVFFGTPNFAANMFTYLVEHNVNIVAVVTKPDKIKGRSGKPSPPTLKIIAHQYDPNIPIYQPEKASDPSFAPTLEQHHADLFVVVAYGEIIKQHLLDMPRLGCINVHASLLPKYRGAAPIQRCLINGDTESGVTIMHMVKKLDAGDMIKTTKVPIPSDMTAGELEEALNYVGCRILLEVIQDFEKGVTTATPQNENLVTYAPKIEPEDCEIHWYKPAHELHNLIRGVTPHPGAWCMVDFEGHYRRVKISKTHLLENLADITFPSPGKILDGNKEGLIVACAKGALQIAYLQLEGKKTLPASEFILGYPLDHL